MINEDCYVYPQEKKNNDILDNISNSMIDVNTVINYNEKIHPDDLSYTNLSNIDDSITLNDNDNIISNTRDNISNTIENIKLDQEGINKNKNINSNHKQKIYYSVYQTLKKNLHSSIELPYLFTPSDSMQNCYIIMGFLSNPIDINQNKTKRCEAGVLLYFKNRLIRRIESVFPAPKKKLENILTGIKIKHIIKKY